VDLLETWLRSLGLERYARVFEENGVDLDSLALLTESDLEKLGVLLGHRKKLLNAVDQRGRTAPDSPATTPSPVSASKPAPSLPSDERR
jgi:hypothetical protein